MEGLGALRRHFPGGDLLPFFVLPTEDRDLKTTNAARMIPVAVNMKLFYDLAEYAARWANTAHNDSKERDRRLFEKAGDDVIIPMVGAALRAVTGNERLRYYSLRHSFANWALTRLQLSDLPVIPDLVPHLPRTREWLRHSLARFMATTGYPIITPGQWQRSWAIRRRTLVLPATAI